MLDEEDRRLGIIGDRLQVVGLWGEGGARLGLLRNWRGSC